MRSASQRMLELTDTPDGASTRNIVEAMWPEEFRDEHGRKRTQRLQHLLAKARSAMVVHERHGRAHQAGTSPGPYNNVRSIIWQITPEGRMWLADNSPENIAAHRASVRQQREDRLAQKILREELLENARQSAGPGTPAPQRREISRKLRAEGCTLQSIALIFGVTRELIRVDCQDIDLARYKLSPEERFRLLEKRWLENTDDGAA